MKQQRVLCPSCHCEFSIDHDNESLHMRYLLVILLMFAAWVAFGIACMTGAFS